jgi:hypothetical protein
MIYVDFYIDYLLGFYIHKHKNESRNANQALSESTFNHVLTLYNRRKALGCTASAASAQAWFKELSMRLKGYLISL